MNKKNPVVYHGQKLRDARLKAAIGTQKELSEKTGIPANIISDLERGKRRMSPSWAQKIAEVLGGDWTDYAN
ncbi:plasmid maintenance system antidote protein [Desulfosporosinus acidiphilus SJ4]|uniref:Plasmid maintenance system antidote protein n=1 Tax=Desulfosporosinus acidiphilus (strain DSM 22704 / JCM 16185 / SJ4) TaxID=646529 RepID=I4DBC7_DESAJ|nr:helix-turn-helix transcriptional regulator [Desulfosporosinus acidiphilus]AFM43101.1 plasmid maintenance system antidote protein [Desulfosporosinus acidiphilus SJ4]